MKSKLKKNVKEYIDNETEKGSLFILEENLLKCPHDWVECILFILNFGLEKNIIHSPCLFMNEEISKKLFETVEKYSVTLNVLSDRHDIRVIWNVLLTKEKNPTTNDYEKILLGGESLRKFCDKYHLYYKTMLTEDKKLLSGSTLMWVKNDNEDCRAID